MPLWFNATFSDVSAIKSRGSCPVSKFRPATGHQRHWQLEVFNVSSLYTYTGTGRPNKYLTSLPSKGSHAAMYAGNRTLFFRSKIQSASSTPLRRTSFFENHEKVSLLLIITTMFKRNTSLPDTGY